MPRFKRPLASSVRGFARTLVPAALLLACMGAQGQSAGGTVSITMTVLSKSNCRFTTAPATSLPFGNIDPSSLAAASVSIAAEFKCGGSASEATFVVSASNGLYHNGATRRMRHANTTHYLPYAISLTPTTGTVPKNTLVPLTITGSVAVTDFRDAIDGAYSDSITVSITP